MECDYEKLENYLNTTIKGIVNNLSNALDNSINEFNSIASRRSKIQYGDRGKSFLDFQWH